MRKKNFQDAARLKLVLGVKGKFLLAVFLFCSLVAPTAAAQLKKVLVLDFKNILKKKDYDYLEGSITDATRNKLKEKFAFQEIERDKWLEVAKENFILEEDLYTYSAAMNVGLAARQDVVIFGGYVVEEKRGTPELRSRVRILDLGKKKQIADFEIKNPVDATIFDAVEKIADRIVKEAAAVLPSKEDAARGRFREEIPTFHQLSLRAHYAPLTFAANRTVASKGQYGASDVRNVVGAVVDFQHFGIFHERLGLFASGGVRMANDKFRYGINNSELPVNLQSFSGFAGIAWRQNLGRRFYLQPYLGAGAQYDILKFTHNSPSVAVGSNVTELSGLAPFAAGGLRFGFALNSWLMLEAGGLYQFLFYQGSTGQSLFAELGVGFKL